jgi:hypothetical protein
MPKQLSTGLYFILLFVNIFIRFIASFYTGALHRHSINLDGAILRLKPFQQNRSKILQLIRSNCSHLTIEYPEFDTASQIELCDGYGLSIKLGKLVVILSSLYNAYLFNDLYSAHRSAIAMVGIMSTLLFYINCINNEYVLLLLELISILLGFLIIIGHYLSSDFDNYLSKQWLKLNNWLSKNKNDHIYDKIHNEEEKHQDS